MRVVTVINEKGGVGKTTTALHVAAGLALMDKKVLLIDADAQGHCGKQLGFDQKGGLYRLLAPEPAEWKDVMVEPEARYWSGMEATVGRLFLLPSNIETRLIPMMAENMLVLRQRLEELEGFIDAVVIDTPPTPSLLQDILYFASDGVLYPTKCEMLSLDGIAKSTFRVAQQNSMRPGYKMPPIHHMGVLPTMYRDTNAHIYGRNLLEKHFGEKLVWDPIVQRTIWTDREYEETSIFAYAEPSHPARKEMNKVVERVAEFALV